MRKFLFFLIFVLSVFAGYTSDPQILIEKANKAYVAGEYDQALTLYNQVMKDGLESPGLYFNIGNSYFKQNNIPAAILNYEKALLLDPADEDMIFNLKVANSRISDKIEPLPVLFYKRWYTSLLQLFSFDGWAKAVVLFFILSLLFFTIYFISRQIILRKTGFWMGFFSFLIALIFSLFAYQSYHSIQNRNEAIIFAPTVTIKSSPDEKSIDLFVLHEGTKVILIDQIGIWYEIRIANGSIGWLPASSIERI